MGEEPVVRGGIAEAGAVVGAAVVPLGWTVAGWPPVAVEPGGAVEAGESGPAGGGPKLPDCALPLPLEAGPGTACDPALLVVASTAAGLVATLG